MNCNGSLNETCAIYAGLSEHSVFFNVESEGSGMQRIVISWIGILILSFAAAPARAERDFTGTTASGAYYKIAVPDSWKDGDSLVLFQHGLSFDPPKPNPTLGPIASVQLSEGYAVAASSFSQRSWALFTAANDNVELLAAFKQKVGTPGAIIPYGGLAGRLDCAQARRRPALLAPVPGVFGMPAGGRIAGVGFDCIDLRLVATTWCAKTLAIWPTGAQPYPVGLQPQ